MCARETPLGVSFGVVRAQRAVLTVTSHARASAAPQPALTMTLGHAWPGGSLCYYKHANTTSFRLDAPSKCKSEQCRLDLLAFQQCPLSHRYSRILPLKEEQKLAAELRRLLQGHRLAIFGDSMARQVFYVLVGLLRGERSFLDPQIWNPARYQFWRSAADYDDLDLFYRPLYCQAAMPFCNRTRRTSVTPWTNRSSSLADLKKWLTLSSSCATFSIGASICEKISLNEDRDGGSEPPDIEVVWIPQPLWSTVHDTLRLAAASEITSGRPFSLVLTFVPSAWHLSKENFVVNGMTPSDAFDQVPSFYWNAWSNWLAQSEAHQKARYAALTMPTEALNCNSTSFKANNELIIRWLNLRNDRDISKRCGPERCCRTAVTLNRNRFEGMPATWLRVDFDALLRTKRTTHLPNNWHYQCILARKGANSCAHRPMTRLGLYDSCNVQHRNLFLTEKQVGWQARESGDCGEDGNTILWQYLASEHTSWFAKTGAERG